MGRLILCSASAGTGKTYSVCEHVVAWLRAGGEPERLLATTFTKKAASELKDRIQSRILEETSLPLPQRLDLAERMELAAIGTVHSVGHQILSRHALDLGLSPSLVVLDENAQTRHVARLLAELPPQAWLDLTERARRLMIDEPERLVLDLLDEKRANAISDDAFLAQMDASAERVCELLGTTDSNAPHPARLYDEIRAALDTISAIADDTKATTSARAKLGRLLNAHSGAWQDFAACAGIAAGKRSGANDALDDLRTYAGSVRVMPALHEDIRGFTRGIANYVVDLSRAYAHYKTHRGLLDFTDLEEHLLELLRDGARAAELSHSLGLVIVDEFQDTSPLQLAIFLRLRELAEESYWVGDPKQAIYGFRGADADLMLAVWDHAPADERRRLETCYRSQAGLVHFYNAAFDPLFGPSVRLGPHRPPEGPALERRLLPSTNLGEDWPALAQTIRELRDEGTAPRDMAILVRTNRHARDAASALRAAGIATTVPLPGLLDMRECRIAVAGLQLAADPQDALAAATILHFLEAHTDATPAWLDTRLKEVRALEGLPKEKRDYTPFASDDRLQRIRQASHAARSPTQTLLDIITQLDLPGRIARWGEPARRSAHLDALIALARKFEKEAITNGEPATVLALTRWLGALAEDEKDELPTPAGLDAVTVLTAFKAKGLQWPVVIVAAFESIRAADPWTIRVSGGTPAAGSPLDDRHIRYWCWPFGTIKGPFGKRHTGCGLETAADESPEGVHTQAAQDAENRRLAYVAFTRAQRRLVIAQRDRKGPEKDIPSAPLLELCPSVETIAPLERGAGVHDADTLGFSYSIQTVAPTAPPMLANSERWIMHPWAATSAAPPRYENPSAAPPIAGTTSDEGDALGGSLPPIHTPRVDALGKAVHAYFAALPSLEHASLLVKAEVALRCLTGFDVTGTMTPEALVAAGDRLVRWVNVSAPNAQWLTEVSVTAPRGAGQQWVGVIDLLLVDGADAMIVDHKSTGRAIATWDAGAISGQLEAYATILGEAGLEPGPPRAHLPYAGRIRTIRIPLLGAATEPPS